MRGDSMPTSVVTPIMPSMAATDAGETHCSANTSRSGMVSFFWGKAR